jgi:Subtilase family
MNAARAESETVSSQQPASAPYLGDRPMSPILSSLLCAGLLRLYRRSTGAAWVRIALLDGRPDLEHPALAEANLTVCPLADMEKDGSTDAHATFLSSLLAGSRKSSFGICCGSPLIVVPIVDRRFREGKLDPAEVAQRVTAGIREAMRQRVDVIQISLDFFELIDRPFNEIGAWIAQAATNGVRTVVTAGNRATFQLNPLLNAPGAIPVVSCDRWGNLHPRSPVSPVLGRKGIRAPGEGLPGAALSGGIEVRSGSSLAACVVTGAFSLLCDAFPLAPHDVIWEALLNLSDPHRCNSIIPPLLNADNAVHTLIGYNYEYHPSSRT